MKYGFCVFILVLFAWLAWSEWRRYRRAAQDVDELPYPRRRLSRRYGLAATLSLAVVVTTLWPTTATAPVQLTLVAVLATLLVLSTTLLWRDLRETTRSALKHSEELTASASEALANALLGRDAEAQKGASQDAPESVREED